MLLTLAVIAGLATPSPQVAVRSDRLPTSGNAYYTGNRSPLAASPFRKLPVGAVLPDGWLRKQLEMEAAGFTGHLTEISEFLKKDNNAWLSPTGAGEHGWEEVPYWLKGFGDLGYLLSDPRIENEAKVWIEGMLGSRQPDGWFGPAANKVANGGKPDMWPNMVALNCLQTYYEHTSDPRVLDLMTAYFRFQLNLPKESMFLSYWEKQRVGDNLASVYWLYNRTGESWLLDLARKMHDRGADWVAGVPDLHGVNFAQAFREPAEMALLTGSWRDENATERDLNWYRTEFGPVPGGLYGADENARTGFNDPRQAAETCAMVEMMLSDEMLLTLTGDARWGERCEDVAFNSLPASMTEDLKALHYLTSPNLVRCDARSKSPGVQNGGPMFLFDPHDHRCCQHNVSHGWPYFVEHLWLASFGNGIAAALYAPSTVTAKVGSSTPVTVREETRYPFDETITFRFSTANPNRFPFTMRIPAWCAAPNVTVNGKPLGLTGSGAYATVDREWRDGDVVKLKLPMTVETHRWAGNHDAVTVQRGPLTYALQIKEKVERAGGTDAWPAYEVLAASPWNFGLEPDASFDVVKRPWPSSGQPFASAKAPIELRARARRIPQWQEDRTGLVGLLQPSPALTTEPEQTVTLVPMGAARLRISMFPTVTADGGHAWKAPARPRAALPAQASFIHPADTTDALTDGILPSSSGDLSVPRFTWWDHKGTTEWVQVQLPKARRISTTRVYWFDDRATGGECRVPATWRVLAKVGGTWQPVTANGEYGVVRDAFNTVAFAPVSSDCFRIEAVFQSGFSAGILEWGLK